MSPGVDWSRWTVVLLKPDCVTRNLVEAVAAEVADEVTVVDQRLVRVTEAQISAHYRDLLTDRRHQFTWVDVEADLRRTYVGQHVGIMLGFGDNAATRLRSRLGHYDPSQADRRTIRGRFGDDSLVRAHAECRLIANLIHSSDDAAGAEREFAIWYGPTQHYLLQATHVARETP